MIFVNLNWNNISQKDFQFTVKSCFQPERQYKYLNERDLLEWEKYTNSWKFTTWISKVLFSSKWRNSCDMELGRIFILLLLLLAFWYFRDIRLGWSDMREISTEEFRKLSADKKAQTLSINTLAYKQGHSYTDKVLKSTDSKDIKGKYLLKPLRNLWRSQR